MTRHQPDLGALCGVVCWFVFGRHLGQITVMVLPILTGFYYFTLWFQKNTGIDIKEMHELLASYASISTHIW